VPSKKTAVDRSGQVLLGARNEFILGLLGADQMTGPFPLDAVPRVDLSSYKQQSTHVLAARAGIGRLQAKEGRAKSHPAVPRALHGGSEAGQY